MCGRSANARGARHVQAAARVARFVGAEKYRPSFNVGLTRYQPVLRRDAATGERELHCMKWGLIPFWTKKAPDMAATLKTINARADSLLENKPMFNACKKSRRCVVICDGFYEWQREGAKARQPYFIRFREDDRPLTLAGVYEVWKDPDAEGEGDEQLVYSYAIVTTEAASYLRFLHDRMPVVLDSEEDIERWLNTDQYTFEQTKDLLVPYEKGKGLLFYPVPSLVNKIGHDSEDCIKDISKSLQAGKITSFFPASPTKSPTKSSPSSSAGSPSATERQRRLDDDEDGEAEAEAEENLFLPDDQNEELEEEGGGEELEESVAKQPDLHPHRDRHEKRPQQPSEQDSGLADWEEEEERKRQKRDDSGTELSADDSAEILDVAVNVSDEALSTLVSMGFTEEQSRSALLMYDNDVNLASNYLMDYEPAL